MRVYAIEVCNASRSLWSAQIYTASPSVRDRPWGDSSLSAEGYPEVDISGYVRPDPSAHCRLHCPMPTHCVILARGQLHGITAWSTRPEDGVRTGVERKATAANSPRIDGPMALSGRPRHRR